MAVDKGKMHLVVLDLADKIINLSKEGGGELNLADVPDLNKEEQEYVFFEFKRILEEISGKKAKLPYNTNN